MKRVKCEFCGNVVLSSSLAKHLKSAFCVRTRTRKKLEEAGWMSLAEAKELLRQEARRSLCACTDGRVLGEVIAAVARTSWSKLLRTYDPVAGFRASLPLYPESALLPRVAVEATMALLHTSPEVHAALHAVYQSYLSVERASAQCQKAVGEVLAVVNNGVRLEEEGFAVSEDVSALATLCSLARYGDGGG